MRCVKQTNRALRARHALRLHTHTPTHCAVAALADPRSFVGTSVHAALLPTVYAGSMLRRFVPPLAAAEPICLHWLDVPFLAAIAISLGNMQRNIVRHQLFAGNSWRISTFAVTFLSYFCVVTERHYQDTAPINLRGAANTLTQLAFYNAFAARRHFACLGEIAATCVLRSGRSVPRCKQLHLPRIACRDEWLTAGGGPSSAKKVRACCYVIALARPTLTR